MLSLHQANRACEFQRGMDNHNAALFARALPNRNDEVDWEAFQAFEAWAFPHPDMADALAFLHSVVADCLPGGFKKLCGV
jgi:hypothetical protein